MTKECIEIIRQSLIPFVKKELLDINYEGLGKSDAEEFEKDLNEILDLAIKALEQQPSEDCVSIAELEKWLDLNFSFGGACRKLELFDRLEKELPPATPTHGTCKDCKHNYIDEDGCGYHCERVDYTRFSVYADFYCKDFKKRGSEE